MAHHGVRNDDQEAILGELGDREVGLQGTALVEPLGIGDEPLGTVNLIAGDSVQTLPRIPTLHQKFPHERHIHEDDVLARSAMLELPAPEPLGSSPRQWTRIGSYAWVAV